MDHIPPSIPLDRKCGSEVVWIISQSNPILHKMVCRKPIEVRGEGVGWKDDTKYKRQSTEDGEVREVGYALAYL